MAQAKDFIGYEGGDSVVIDDQALHEIYLKPFQDTVDAGVSSVMCGYQKINGIVNCGDATTLNGILRTSSSSRVTSPPSGEATTTRTSSTPVWISRCPA